MDSTLCNIFLTVSYFHHISSTIAVKQTVFVKEGLAVVFSCPFQAVTKPIIWRGPPNLTLYSIGIKINGQIDKLDKINVNGNSTTQKYNLSISNFTTTDEGLYRCETILDKHSKRHEIVVHLAEPPTNMKIVNETQDGLIFGQQNSSLLLICTVDRGQPPNTLNMKFENISITSNSSEFILHLFVARPHQHLKQVECIAENLFYRLVKEVQLYMYISPVVRVNVDPSAILEEGHNFTLTCWYESNTNETFMRWKRNDRHLINVQSRNLSVTNVSREDAGKYCCEVGNRIGIGTDMISITVLYKPRVMSHSNTFEIESDFEKPSFISFIIASGTKPYIVWTYNLGGKTGYWNVQDIGEEIYNVSSTIVPFEKSHLGQYSVRVLNKIGSIDLKIELVGFKVNVFPSTLVCNMSNVIELTCNVSQYTASNLSNIWIHSYDGTEIRSLQGSIEKRSSKLRIPFCDYRDAGTYTCMWKSSTIMQSFSSTIYVQSHPVLTSILTFNQIETTTLKVRFFSFPPPLEVSWFYKDKPISKPKLSVGKNMQKTGVNLQIKTKLILVNGYVTSYQINETRSPVVEHYSCQVRNIIGNLNVSFQEFNITGNITSKTARVDGIIHWSIYVLMGIFFTVVVMIITISVLSDRDLLQKYGNQGGQNTIQSEQEIGSRNSSQSATRHSYEEVDIEYYHTMEWRNFVVETSLPANNAMTVNTDASFENRNAEKTRDCTYQSKTDVATNSCMKIF